jgi:hypothetical protein
MESGIKEMDWVKTKSGYLERTSCIGCGIPAAGDHLISRLEAAPTGVFFMVTWTFRISAKQNI